MERFGDGEIRGPAIARFAIGYILRSVLSKTDQRFTPSTYQVWRPGLQSTPTVCHPVVQSVALRIFALAPPTMKW